MIRMLTASALLLRTASPCLPRDVAHQRSAASAATAGFPVLEDIRWFYEPAHINQISTHQLRITREGMSTTFDERETHAIMGGGAAASLASPGEAVSFALARPAGALACRGKVESAQRASGTCRFDPDEGFIAALTQRGLKPEDSNEVMALALVDARIESVDELLNAGFTFEGADNVIAVAALEVTAGFARELREAGLKITDIEDLITAKAVELDPAWLSAMADAGYPGLDTEEAIELRALGVTPDYARKMARVSAALEESEAR